MTPPVKSSACLFHFHATQQAVGPGLKRSPRSPTPSPIKLPASVKGVQRLPWILPQTAVQ